VSGNAVFDGVVGGTPLTSLHVTQGTAINTSAITTTGNQTYDNAVTVSTNTILSGTNPTFGSTVNGVGSPDLTLTFSGPTTITGATFTNFRNLATDGGGTTNLSGSVTTSGAQSYEYTAAGTTSVVLAGPTTLTGTSVNAGPITGGGNNLTIATSGTDSIESGSGINALSLNKTAGTISFLGNLSANSLSTAANGFSVGFNTGAAAPYSNSATTIPTVAFSNTGTISLGNEPGDVASFANGLNTTSASTTSLGGTISTASTAITLGNAAVAANTTIQNTGGGVAPINFSTITTAAPGSLTVHAQGPLNFNGAATINGALAADTVNGSITTLAGQVTTTSGDVSFTANSPSSAVTVGTGGIKSAGNLSLTAAGDSAGTTGINVNGTVSALNGVATLVAGSAPGMGSFGVTPASGGGIDAPININAPILAGTNNQYNVRLFSTGAINQDTVATAGIQTTHSVVGTNGGLQAVTFNDSGRAITLKNSIATGSPICGTAVGGTGTGNCVGLIDLRAMNSIASTQFAPGNINYNSINNVSINTIGTGGSVVLQGPSLTLTTFPVNVTAHDVFLFATNGDVTMAIPITNSQVNSGITGGSWQMYALGNIIVNNPGPASSGVAFGQRSGTDASGNPQYTAFDHDLKMVATNNITINGSIIATGAITLRADADPNEVNITNVLNGTTTVKAGDGFGGVSIINPGTAPGFGVEVRGSSITVGLPNAPVQFLNIQAASANATGANPLQRGDAILDTTAGDITVNLGTGNLTLTGGTASAVTTSNGQVLKATALATIQGTNIEIDGNSGNIVLQGGNATANNISGGGALASADASIIATASKNLSFGGDMKLFGGTTNGGLAPAPGNSGVVSASATIDPTLLTITTGGNVIVKAGQGVGADANILNGADIQFFIGGNQTFSYTSTALGGGTTTTLSPGLILIGGSGSGLFGAGNVPKILGDEIKATFGGGGTFTQFNDPGLAPATIVANSPRNFDSLLSYIIFAANQETQAARIRSGQTSLDDSNLPSCN
jgi:hypothetical protein